MTWFTEENGWYEKRRACACALKRVWRIFAGAVCGAVLGYCLPRVLGPNAKDPTLPIVFASIMAVLGAVASGFLSGTGWSMLAGGIIGAIVVGICGVLATLHTKGLVYSFLGAPLGAFLVLLYRLEHEKAKAAQKKPPSKLQPAVWDDELDR
jgi:peptidoglycan/LPS O-acetylase OafA/YrhL